MRRSLALLLALAAPVVLASGCGESADAEPVATSSVTMPKSYRFEPETIVVAAGTSVTWTNDDNFTHTVKVEDDPDHKVGRGESVTIRFARAGTFHYVCTLHRHDMHGTVIVR